MSDNNADFNGNGQINNPTSGDATQADFGQTYGPAQGDAQMRGPETQPGASPYGQPVDHGQQTQPSYDRPSYDQPVSPAPSYDPNSGSYAQSGYNQYDQPDYGQSAYGQPNYGQPTSAYDPNASSYSQYAQPSQQPATPTPSYDPSGAYSQQPYAYGQPAYGQSAYTQQSAYGQPNYGQQGYAPYNQSAYTQYTQQPAYGQPVPMGYSQKSKLAAGLLAIFLGCFGVHNFYLGNTGKAVTQLLLTLLGWIIIIGPAAAGIWGLVEGILILCSHTGSQWHRDGKGVELQD